VVVAVGLAVGGDVGELSFAGVVCGARAEAAEQAAAEGFAGVEQAFEREEGPS